MDDIRMRVSLFDIQYNLPYSPSIETDIYNVIVKSYINIDSTNIVWWLQPKVQ